MFVCRASNTFSWNFVWTLCRYESNIMYILLNFLRLIITTWRLCIFVKSKMSNHFLISHSNTVISRQIRVKPLTFLHLCYFYWPSQEWQIDVSTWWAPVRHTIEHYSTCIAIKPRKYVITTLKCCQPDMKLQSIQFSSMH